MLKEWGEAGITEISTRDVADFLLKWDAAGKKRMAQAMRSLLLDLFREAVAAGWVDRNPVEPTRALRVQVTRARLTLEAYQAIHAIALRDYPAWLARAMELVLVTAQRREDIATMGPRSIHDGKLRLHTIAAAFAEACDKTGLTWPAGKTPPTFHEIRSR